MHNAPGACLNMLLEQSTFKIVLVMLLEQIELRILPQIIHALGAVPGAAAPGA